MPVGLAQTARAGLWRRLVDVDRHSVGVEGAEPVHTPCSKPWWRFYLGAERYEPRIHIIDADDLQPDGGTRLVAVCHRVHFDEFYLRRVRRLEEGAVAHVRPFVDET